MYSTSPSSSSMASSSGRSSPEQSAPQPASQPQRSNSFLLPQFLFGSSSSTNTATNESTPHPVTNALLAQPPRRTSFGAGFSNGGRLSALSAFGFMSSSGSSFGSAALSSSPPPSLAGAAALSRQTESAIDSPSSESLPSSLSALPQKAAPTTASPPPAKRHLCFPDGMGGTMCVEVKDRNRRGSSIN